jgi:hypothetical protein
MSKKRKSNRKPLQQPAKKVIVPPAIKATNGRARPVRAEPGVLKSVALAPASAADVAPVTVAHDRDVRLPFWARMPFAIMDFWLARRERGHGKS